MTDIYSPEIIARSRARAEQIRAQVAAGTLHDAATWLAMADAVDLDAARREADPEGHRAGKYETTEWAGA